MSLDLARHLTRHDWGHARNMFEGGASSAEIAKRFAIPSATIGNIARREGWTNAVGLDGRHEPEPGGDAAPSGSQPPTDAQRDALSRQTLNRFVRDRNKPEELETLRYNLIVARVMSGMTAVDAAERFGYKNSTQLSLIESGKRPTPRDHQFLRQASQVYAVSCDFLLGLSPHMEYDARVAHQHALMRGTESILGGIAAQFATVMIQFTEQTKPVQEDFGRVTDAARTVEQALDMARKHGLDEIRGSSALVAAAEQLAKAVEPLRQKVKRHRAIESYLDELRAGRMPRLDYLVEHHAPDGWTGEYASA
ncbi:helix-turn-helix domain-containing protein [Paraburkholderia sp. BR10937]|uniref:helix-turn-helix domain-containing protein n=1 Tax=Paraburkholderia sp. BR10937 TaxID=3236994 RepID=UPI0034D277FD